MTDHYDQLLAPMEMDAPDAPNVAVWFEYVTPARATELKTNKPGAPKNRKFRPSVAKTYAAEMREGTFRFDGAPVRLDADGNSLDGQHRLAAIIESGEPQWMLIVDGLPAVTQRTMDTNRGRNFADVLHMEDETNPEQLAATTRSMFHFEQTGKPDTHGRSPVRVTNTNQFACLERNPGLRDSLARASRSARVLRRHNRQAIYHYLFTQVDPDEADAFMDQVVTGKGFPDDSQIEVLRRRLIREQEMAGFHGVSARTEGILVIKAWNAWMTGVPITKLQVGGSFPKIYGYPYHRHPNITP